MQYMTEDEIRFMQYFEGTMLPNKNRITVEMLIKSAEFAHIHVETGCPSCRQNSAIDLKNLYNRILPAWQTWQIEQAEIKREEEAKLKSEEEAKLKVEKNKKK